MAHDAATQRARLREAILSYIKKYPLAADTVAGIVACWLPHSGFENAQDHMEAVLEDMVARRWLQARPLPDGNILYTRSNPPDR